MMLLNTVSTMTSECFLVRSETRRLPPRAPLWSCCRQAYSSSAPWLRDSGLAAHDAQPDLSLLPVPEVIPERRRAGPFAFLVVSQSARYSSLFNARMLRPIFRSCGLSLMIFI
jgi:hypothetical protein